MINLVSDLQGTNKGSMILVLLLAATVLALTTVFDTVMMSLNVY